MIFEKDTLRFEMLTPAQYPMSHNTELVQARDKSSSGIVHIEDFEVMTNTITFNFVNLLNSDYNDLMNWFLNVSVGMLNTFHLTDDLTIRRLVRFTTPTLAFSKDSYNHYNGSFTVEEVR